MMQGTPTDVNYVIRAVKIPAWMGFLKKIYILLNRRLDMWDPKRISKRQGTAFPTYVLSQTLKIA